MPRITISYRRDDSGVITGRIYDRLVARYGRGTVFRDIDDNPIGVDFRIHIGKALSSSDAVLAIVGPHWAGPSASQSRLSNEADPVRIEIETALAEGIPIIPVLVLGAAMPTTVELPESLREFAYRNAVQIDHGQDFDIGMGRLIRALDAIVGVSADAPAQEKRSTDFGRAESPKRFAVLGTAAFAVLAAASAIGWYVGTHQQQPMPSTTDKIITSTRPQAAAPLPAALPTPAIDAELLFWQSIEKSTNASDFEEYLRKYPNGQFAGLARNRVATLRPPIAKPAPQVSATEAMQKAKAAVLAPTSNFNEAARWYRVAAELGDPEGRYELGNLLDKGIGVPESAQEAAHWYLMAAKSGVALAAYSLGGLYYHGRGVSQSYREAMNWFSKAGDGGWLDGYCSVGLMYREGRGVQRNPAQAAVWFRKSDAAGYSCFQE